MLNFLNRHRALGDGFYAFIQNLTVAMTGARGSACVISLPRSQVEMTEGDLVWQERITKVVKRVAKDLLVNDEAEISEVLRRRLFESLGKESERKAVALAYANWCFEHRSQLPQEWTAVDSSATEAKARDYLRGRFEACYPFHPATLTVFQRKWRIARAISTDPRNAGDVRTMDFDRVRQGASRGAASSRSSRLARLRCRIARFASVVSGPVGRDAA